MLELDPYSFLGKDVRLDWDVKDPKLTMELPSLPVSSLVLCVEGFFVRFLAFY